MEPQTGILAKMQMLEIDETRFVFQTQGHSDNHMVKTLGINLQQVDGTNVFLFQKLRQWQRGNLDAPDVSFFHSVLKKMLTRKTRELLSGVRTVLRERENRSSPKKFINSDLTTRNVRTG